MRIVDSPLHRHSFARLHGDIKTEWDQSLEAIMLVTDIEITQYSYCPRSARHMANVCLTLKNHAVSLFCQVDLPEHENGATRAAAFVSDAVRQLRRMPEFRSGETSLEIVGDPGTVPVLQSA